MWKFDVPVCGGTLWIGVLPYTQRASEILNIGDPYHCTCLECFMSTIYSLHMVLQGDSVTRGPKLLSTYCHSINGWWTNYWVLPTRWCNMSHFKCQHARNWKFFSRWNYLKKPLATQISRSQHVTLQMPACEKLKVFSRRNYLKKPLATQISRSQHVTLQMPACEKLKVFFKTELSQKTFGHPDLPI